MSQEVVLSSSEEQLKQGKFNLGLPDHPIMGRYIHEQQLREAIDKCSYEIDDKHGEWGVSLRVDPYKLKEELGL